MNNACITPSVEPDKSQCAVNKVVLSSSVLIPAHTHPTRLHQAAEIRRTHSRQRALQHTHTVPCICVDCSVCGCSATSHKVVHRPAAWASPRNMSRPTDPETGRRLLASSGGRGRGWGWEIYSNLCLNKASRWY